jgi:hypothetical protein
MPPFRTFDPYKKDEDRRLHERGQETKARREFQQRGLGLPQQQHVFAALARRKKRPVTLPPIK